jgi:hypothetical protein
MLMKNHIELLRDYGFKWGNPREDGQFEQNDGTAMFLQGPDGTVWKNSQLNEIIADIQSGALQQRLAANPGDALQAILNSHSQEIAVMVENLRDLVKQSAPHLREEVKTGWGAIVYRAEGMVCAISPHKTHVNLSFYNGAHLSDSDGLLQGIGKDMRHVKIYCGEEIRWQALSEMLHEACQFAQS